MIDWAARQRECPKCHGIGYTFSEARHANGYQPHAWAAQCECQPQTFDERLEAAAQEMK